MTNGRDDSPVKTDASERRRPRRRRRWPAILAFLLVPLAVAYLLACNYLERKIEASVAGKLDAELRVHGLLYIPPYGIRLSGANLVRKNNVILNLGRVHLKLAESPFGDGPIVIENFDVVRPQVRIIRTAQGLQGGPGFVKDEVKHEPEPRKKFSDFLRLRRFKVSGGQVVYDDDTTPYARDVTWRDIDVEINTAQKGPALYTYEATFGNAPVVDVSASGSVDVDALVMALDRVHVGVRVDPKQEESPLPGELQALLKDYGVAGRLSIDGRGSVPFRELGKAKYDGTIELAGGAFHVPKWKAGVDDASIKLRVATTQPTTAPTTKPTAPPLNVYVENVHVGAGGATLALTSGALAIDPASQTWTLRELAGRLEASATPSAKAVALRDAIERFRIAGVVDFTAAADGPLKPDTSRRLGESIRHEVLLYPRGVAFQPKDWPQPLRELGGGVVRVAGGAATAENLSALYGEDRWLLDAARLPLRNLRERVIIEGIVGSFDFQPPSPEYPKALRATVRTLAPTGEFAVGGRMAIDLNAEPGHRATYDFTVTSNRGSFAVSPKRIPITNIRGDARVARETIEVGTVAIDNFDGDSLGGAVSAKATFITTSPRSYAGTATLRDVKIEELAPYFAGASSEQKQKFVGRASANAELSGDLQKETALDSLLGRGRLEVFDGNFFELPVLRPVERAVAGERKGEMSTVGEAAVLFSVKGKTVRIREAALSAPLLGVQGDGAVTLDGKLDVNLVAAPLADWRDKLKQTNIPIVSDVTGEVAGAIQRTLNAATRGLLYEFEVRGDVKDPQVKTVPAPALNEARAALFGQMLQSRRDRPLIDSLKGEEEKK